MQVEVHHTKNNASVSSGPIDMQTKALGEWTQLHFWRGEWEGGLEGRWHVWHKDKWICSPSQCLKLMLGVRVPVFA